MERHFRAPWSNVVKAITLGMLLLFGALIYYNPSAITITTAILITGGSALFMVRSYTLKNKMLIVRRLGWNTTFDLTKLQDVEIRRDAMSGSWRMLGIGGYLGFIGSFHNKQLGNYRAYATHRLNCVVLTFKTETIVVTPDAPQDFVEAVREAVKS